MSRPPSAYGFGTNPGTPSPSRPPSAYGFEADANTMGMPYPRSQPIRTQYIAYQMPMHRLAFKAESIQHVVRTVRVLQLASIAPRVATHLRQVTIENAEKMKLLQYNNAAIALLLGLGNVEPSPSIWTPANISQHSTEHHQRQAMDSVLIGVVSRRALRAVFDWDACPCVCVCARAHVCVYTGEREKERA